MNFQEQLHTLGGLDCAGLYQDDFFLTWDKSQDEMRAVLAVADALRALRENNKSARIFDSGLGISLFRDNSTRTRFSYSSACNLLGLAVQDFDEGKSQQAHGESVRETANMISFMADVIGIRDDMYIGKGHTYMKDFAGYLQEGYDAGVLEQRPTLVSLQCDIDHPSQSTADLLHLIHTFGGLENLRGKKLAMTWAYSPSYGKPLSVPQGMIGLMTRYGMDVTLAHPQGYDVMADTRDIAAKNALQSGGSFTVTHSMAEAFEGADIVCPKSWAPFEAMQERTDLYGEGDFDGISALEQRLLRQNAEHQDWATTEAMMALTKGTRGTTGPGEDTDGEALYMHPLPADISGLSCDQGEVDRSVFDRYRVPLYQQASNKPYAIAAMIFLQKVKDPAAKLQELWDRDLPRWQR